LFWKAPSVVLNKTAAIWIFRPSRFSPERLNAFGIVAFAGALGPGSVRQSSQRTGVENETKLVLDFDRRQNDSARCPACDGKRAGSTVKEAKGSHSIYVSQPQAVASLIEEAAKGAVAGAK
jgi:hypothetical protein